MVVQLLIILLVLCIDWYIYNRWLHRTYTKKIIYLCILLYLLNYGILYSSKTIIDDLSIKFNKIIIFSDYSFEILLNYQLGFNITALLGVCYSFFDSSIGLLSCLGLGIINLLYLSIYDEILEDLWVFGVSSLLFFINWVKSVKSPHHGMISNCLMFINKGLFFDNILIVLAKFSRINYSPEILILQSLHLLLTLVIILVSVGFYIPVIHGIAKCLDEYVTDFRENNKFDYNSALNVLRIIEMQLLVLFFVFSLYLCHDLIKYLLSFEIYIFKETLYVIFSFYIGVVLCFPHMLTDDFSICLKNTVCFYIQVSMFRCFFEVIK